MHKTYLLFSGLGLFGLLISYQNCSNVDLAMRAPAPELMKLSSEGSFCSLPALSSRDKIKFLFLVDMSASNQAPINSPKPGSDLASQRFQAIENFLTQDCIKENSNVEIAVVGFAHQHILPPGRSSCDRQQFVDKNQIQSLLQFYREEDQRVNQDCVNGASGRCSTYTTNYLAGLDCAKGILTDDIQYDRNGNDRAAFYMNYFLTDGAPSKDLDSDGVVSTDEEDDFFARLIASIGEIRDLTTRDAMGMQLQPIFYGGEAFQTPEADEVLRRMASEGFTNYVSIDSVGDLQLCDYLNSGTRVPYVLEHFVATNLTATNRRGEILADSDMDGIPDREEEIRGFSPQRARSLAPQTSILDGACGGLDAESCSRASIDNCGSANALGITQCDVDRLSLSNGIDSNGDGLLDRLRLVKGLAVNASSPFNEGDNMPEFQEVLLGRDPMSFDDDFAPEYSFRFRIERGVDPTGQCPADQQYFRFRLDQIPLVRTLAMDSSDAISQQTPWLHHGRDENIILIYYILRPANASLRGALRPQVYAKFLKIDFNGATILSDSGFMKVGELFDTFTEAMP